ncbi:MAG: bifunctional diaminohydroxyphosphoribosylaminopyrimidine deaminase/5-amino-6-(5-phosphoribosylamino)uracil reductase RibD [Flavobacteriales bacterium]|nr:bifunctional diaminohydroxyphosphoribosylaminopyrimidine deaminase/5-amino-6-(5-phosphoribosylamino)uracil reductase RibD [Flavobacteriales bacterium]MBK6883923.1 bifunctional diaminohydroxyphosphoribosylaminopyrimidine deaminase/5-amino-6-(5-phosphoribosylamino)uracil reductase RibD [Flavobacteriales bacterium]MBP9176011.1 bifunctional diaminohydroxyphosphoribosylaminopyrimidine deaminase/5-amino-6-(5-phosphoribosylamino)uracil reductase RibD [Flavobacteriales bacterium]MCC6910689.1 bifuncti
MPQDRTELDHQKWMHRCIQLADLGKEWVAPNPMVGAVLVHDGGVLSEGWHHTFGSTHAEVECLRGWPGEIPTGAVLYVNLEPCAHHGKTPPCADLLIERGVKSVVVGLQDPFAAVAGKGIARLRAAGVDVRVGVLEAECRWAQRRFLTSVEVERPYIILKWARTADGFLDQQPRISRTVQRISTPATDTLVHRWRSAEQAILVGSRTVVNDDPSLTVRLVAGRQPLRVVLDREGITPAASHVYDAQGPTLLFTGLQRNDISADQFRIETDTDPITCILEELHRRSIRSLLVEGGAELHTHLLRSGRWDEVRVITGSGKFDRGTPAPQMDGTAAMRRTSDTDLIELFVNPMSPITKDLQIDPEWHL